ncbi:MAG: hypothetical protein IPM54_37135 [Polyangiaceae bacterium]|nr:hypothetical protein [Polyangiaceae bacterium]
MTTKIARIERTTNCSAQTPRYNDAMIESLVSDNDVENHRNMIGAMGCSCAHRTCADHPDHVNDTRNFLANVCSNEPMLYQSVTPTTVPQDAHTMNMNA